MRNSLLCNAFILSVFLGFAVQIFASQRNWSTRIYGLRNEGLQSRRA